MSTHRRPTREDLSELVQEIESLRASFKKDALSDAVADRLESVVNIASNLALELALLELRIERLEIGWRNQR